MIHKNCEIRLVRRAGAIDRYGQPKYETEYSKLFGRLDENSTQVLGANGTQVTIDATLILDPIYQLLPGDLITLERPREHEYKVLNAREARDVVGNVQYREYRLMKQAEGV